MPLRMPPRTDQDAVIGRRVRALARAIRGAERGEPRAIHKARVASRRVREAIPIALASAPARKRRKLRMRVARITRALGPVRELDVTLALVDELAIERPGLSSALLSLRTELERERRADFGRMRSRVDAADVNKIDARVRRLVEMEAGDSAELHGRAALMVRLTRRVEALDEAMRAAGPLYAASPIHTVRIAIKKLRYAFELAQELRLLRSRGVLPRLRNMQQTLGRLHDLQVLHARVDEARAKVLVADEVAASLDELAAFLEESSRRLHARFLARRDALRQSVESALAETASRAAEAAPAARAPRAAVH